MDALIPRCCGLDVHQKTVVASVRILGPTGEVSRETRTFGTTTRELEGLAAWLRPFQITHIAMEATGVLWKPVWHVLEPEWHLLLVNPQHLKRVPGRKSDVQDAEWIAQLLQCGLLRGSVPARLIVTVLQVLSILGSLFLAVAYIGDASVIGEWLGLAVSVVLLILLWTPKASRFFTGSSQSAAS